MRPQIRGPREASEGARLEVSESLRGADVGAWRALRERDLRLKSQIRGLRGPQRARFEAQRVRFEAHRARFEVSEALGEPDQCHQCFWEEQQQLWDLAE